MVLGSIERVGEEVSLGGWRAAFGETLGVEKAEKAEGRSWIGGMGAVVSGCTEGEGRGVAFGVIWAAEIRAGIMEERSRLAPSPVGEGGERGSPPAGAERSLMIIEGGGETVEGVIEAPERPMFANAF